MEFHTLMCKYSVVIFLRWILQVQLQFDNKKNIVLSFESKILLLVDPLDEIVTFSVQNYCVIILWRHDIT